MSSWLQCSVKARSLLTRGRLRARVRQREGPPDSTKLFLAPEGGDNLDAGVGDGQ